jgi:hypothetical protein
MAQLAVPHATDPNLPTYRIHCHSSQGISMGDLSKNNLRFTLPPFFPVNDLDSIVARVALTQAVIPCSWYNISSTLGNHVIQVRIYDSQGNTTLLQCVLKNGQYDVNSIVDAWNAYTPRLVMGFDLLTGKFTLTFNTSDSQYNSSLYAIVEDQLSNRQLGFVAGDRVTTLSTYYGTYIANLKITDNVLVCFQEVQPSFLSSVFQFQTTGSCLAAVPANVTFGEEISYEPSEMHYHENRNFLLTSITISLLDDLGRPIDFNDQDWSIVFEVDYVLNENVLYNHPTATPHPVLTRNNPLSADRLIRNMDLGAPLYLSRR